MWALFVLQVHIRITETDGDIVDAGRPHTRLLWDAIFAPAPPLTKLEKVSGDMVSIIVHLTLGWVGGQEVI